MRCDCQALFSYLCVRNVCTMLKIKKIEIGSFFLFYE